MGETYNPKYNEANYEYRKKNIKRIPLDVPKSFYDEIKASAGETKVNAYIKEAISMRMSESNERADNKRNILYLFTDEQRQQIKTVSAICKLTEEEFIVKAVGQYIKEIASEKADTLKSAPSENKSSKLPDDMPLIAKPQKRGSKLPDDIALMGENKQIPGGISSTEKASSSENPGT